MFTYEYLSPIGEILLVSDGKALTGLYFVYQKHFPKFEKNNIHLDLFNQVMHYLDNYFKGLQPEIDFQIKLNGTPFQLSVWHALLDIPYGTTLTYKDIGNKINKKCYQSIGQAIGHNPISIIVPCHRVIGSDGSLTGYAGGLDKKIYLLNLERRK